jgi:hypothetical protein
VVPIEVAYRLQLRGQSRYWAQNPHRVRFSADPMKGRTPSGKWFHSAP